ncbi:MAG: IS110 family transposase [Planctomycetes bacterium]|nr:IS110 family transposase [Planctomycetota bacterium]
MTQNSKNDFPRTIGMDLGATSSSFCSVDPGGVILDEGALKTTQEEIGAFFEQAPPSRVVIEASGPSRWVAVLAAEHEHEVIVANPRDFKLISHSHRKTDRNDARILAEFGQFRPNLLKPVQLRGLKCQIARTTLAARSHVVRQRTLLINLIRAQVRNMGQSLPTGSASSFSRKVKDLIPAALRPALGPLFLVLDAMMETIAAYDREIERLCEEDFQETKVLRQVNGVGPNTALAFIATIEDPSRFAKSRDVGAYVGLVSKSRSSGSKDPQLRISKRGDKVLRRLLVTSATYICGPRSKDSDLKRFAMRLQERGGQSAKAKARIAVARKLSVLLHRLLITGEVYEPLRNSAKLAA